MQADYWAPLLGPFCRTLIAWSASRILPSLKRAHDPSPTIFPFWGQFLTNAGQICWPSVCGDHIRYRGHDYEATHPQTNTPGEYSKSGPAMRSYTTGSFVTCRQPPTGRNDQAKVDRIVYSLRNDQVREGGWQAPIVLGGHWLV